MLSLETLCLSVFGSLHHESCNLCHMLQPPGYSAIFHDQNIRAKCWCTETPETKSKVNPSSNAFLSDTCRHETLHITWWCTVYHVQFFFFQLCAFLPTVNTVGTCLWKQFGPCLPFVIPLIVNRVSKVVTVLYSFQAFCQTERFGILVLPASLEFCSQFLILLYCCISDSNVCARSVWFVLLLTHFI